ncbi:MAG: hypothetical protein ACE5PT_11185 [Gemmatimonadales bacterium]
MPASSRLLQKLKETWGEEVTQDLVAWVNEGRTVNRAELRDLADLYYARFGDRLEERIALSEARFEAKLTDLEGRMNARFADLEGRMNAGFADLEGRMNAGFADLEGRVNAGFADLEGRVNTGLAALRAEIASQMRDQMKWMFIFWIGTLVPLAGLMLALGKDWL